VNIVRRMEGGMEDGGWRMEDGRWKMEDGTDYSSYHRRIGGG